MICFIRSVHRYTNISGLFGSQLSQFHTDLFKMQASHFLVQMLRQAIYIDIIFLVEQFYLRQCLIGK